MKAFFRFLLKAAVALICGVFFTSAAFNFMSNNAAVAWLAFPASIILFFSITAGGARIFDELFPPRPRS